jgi:hypothetical protein
VSVVRRKSTAVKTKNSGRYSTGKKDQEIYNDPSTSLRRMDNDGMPTIELTNMDK